MKIKSRRIPGIEFFSIIFLVILLIFGVSGIISYQNASKVLKNSIINSAVSRTEDNANLLNQHLNEFKTIIEGISFREDIQSMIWQIQKPVLIEEAKRLGVLRFQVTDIYGNGNCTTGVVLDLSQKEWIRRALKGETFISEPFDGVIENKNILVCTAPIKNGKGVIVGTLSASIDPLYINNMISKLTMGDTGFSFIVSKRGRLIAHPDIELIQSDKSITAMNPAFIHLYRDIKINNIGYTFYNNSDVSYFASFSKITPSGWFLVLTAPEKEVFKDLETLKKNFLILTFITVAAGILCCVLLVSYVLKTKIIERLKMLVEEDKRLLKESAELESLRTQFFANITHDFRTPLNVILASIQLCKFYFDRETHPGAINLSKHLKTMRQNCYRLMRLVNNLIDTTKIDVGFLKKYSCNHNIVKIVEDITLSIKEFTENKGINLYFEKNAQEIILACDVDKIERIMLNLISNAIKFTEKGGSIFIMIQDRGESVLISVKDTGIGIPKEKQQSIFERFVQVEQTLVKNTDGSGIGLSMVKSFVEMHGGSIRIVSEFGKGSEFLVELPIITVDNTDDKRGEEFLTEEVECQRRIERINIEFSDIYYS